MRPCLRIAIAGVVLGLIVTACGSGSSGAMPSAGGSADTTGSSGAAGDLTTVRVASSPDVDSLSLYVAMDEGMFRKNGINVNYTEVNDIATLPPTLGKTFDVVKVTPIAAVQATQHGIPVMEIAGMDTNLVSDPLGALMVAKGSGITELSQLAGKTIGALTVVGTLNYATLKMLAGAGVSKDSVKVIQVAGPQQAAQLKSGRIDAVETYYPFSAEIKENGGVVLGHPFESVAPTITTAWWGANASWAKSHQNTVQDFSRALSQAATYIDTHKAQAQSILQKYTKLPMSVIQSLPLPHYDAGVRPQDIPKWVALMKEVAGFSGSVDVNDMVYSGS